MITFEDGPAIGQRLELKRAPVFLRVVRDRLTGKWDALDAVMDFPKPSEDVWLYRRQGQPIRYHVSRRPACGSWGCIAGYRLNAEQAPEEVMRQNKLWQAWCEKRIGRD